MPPNRLLVDEITSIGMVSKGDSPLAEVLIYKSRPATESGEEWSKRINAEFAAIERRIDRVKRTRHRPLTKTEGTPPMPEYETLRQLVDAKLDKWASRVALEKEIQGAYGFLSRSRAESVNKVRAEWWGTHDGRATNDLLREHGNEAPDLTTIQKSHTEAAAAIARLDG